MTLPLRLGRSAAVLGALVGVGALAVLAVVLLPPPAEETASERPEAVEPFGLVRREELRFRWVPPVGGMPVRVEVLDAARRIVWRSEPIRGTTLAPDPRSARVLPGGDLYWRAVAVSADGPERPGDLAAFTLVEADSPD